MRRAIQTSILLVMLLGVSPSASANEFTEVIDSFDYAVNDPFDLHFSVGYLLKSKRGTITRETMLAPPGRTDHYAYQNMFEFKHVQHVLDLNLEVGIFRDVSIRFGLPLILSDTRTLTVHPDWDPTAGRAWLTSNAADANANPLFGDFATDNTFESPKRSGIDYFTFGIWANPLDQSRDETYPNWTLFLEGRFGVGKLLDASCAAGQRVPNADGAIVDCPSIDQGGVSRGVNGFRLGTRMSRRIGIFDPYFGFDATAEFPKDKSDYFITDNEGGQINTRPPIRGRLDFGTEIVPWEQPAKHRRVVVAIGAGAMYLSEGREYTPLYDALGTSRYFLDNDTVNFGGVQQDVGEWSGMTDIENYATVFGTWWVLVEPAKYIKFRIGGWLAHETQHFITKTDMCSLDFMGAATDALAGESTEICGEFNDGYRPELDDAGSRFRAEKTLYGKFFLDLTAMF